MVSAKDNTLELFLDIKVRSNELGTDQYDHGGTGAAFGCAYERISWHNIGDYILPIVQYIRKTSPDHIIAIDRGGRLVGLAAKILYRELYGDLPTVGGMIKFVYFSNRLKPYVSAYRLSKENIKPLVAEILNNAPTGKSKVTILDDYAGSCETLRGIRKIFNELSGGTLELSAAVMQGIGGNYGGADISSSERHIRTWDWEVYEQLSGVDYVPENFKPVIIKMQDTPLGCIPSGKVPHIWYRERMIEALQDFAKRLKREASLVSSNTGR